MKTSLVLWLGILLALLGALLLVVLPVTANLIISLVFWLLAIAFLLYGVYVLGVQKKSLILEWPLFEKARAYLFVTAVISIAVLAAENLKLYSLPAIFHLLIQGAALLILGIKVLPLLMGKSHIQQQDSKVAQARGSLLNLVNDVRAFKPRADRFPEADRQRIRQAIEEVAQALRYADPMSTPAVQALDEQIKGGVQVLGQALAGDDTQEVLNQAKTLVNDIKERGQRLVSSK